MMYCPQCRAEYREGFTRCSDCQVELVEVLPALEPGSSVYPEHERPDLAPTRYFLAWLVPMCIYFSLIFVMWVRPFVVSNLFIMIPFFFLHLLAVVGTFWMLYQAVRYERRVLRYVLLAGIPFMFVWYSLVRVPLRKEFSRSSPFIR